MADKLTLKFEDGTSVDVTARPIDVVKFERKYGVAADKLGERIEYSMYIAWCALTRTGETSDEFDDWLEKVVDVEGDVTANPTLPPPNG